MRPDERIYRYVVAYDGGTAPRPYDGVCSLALCKPRIRATAQVGDWIIGFRSRRPGDVIYVMQVSERMTLGEYWLDPRFADRRPGGTHLPDNIYEPVAGGSLHQAPNRVHGPENVERDCSGRNVLLGERFWYFGGSSVPLPNELMHLVHTTQGHVVHRGRKPDDVSRLRQWLAAWPPGMHGKPLDPPRLLPEASGGPAVAGTSIPRPSRSSCSTRLGPRPAQPVRHRRIILSRKGFDSSYGGMPSPILPDGRLLPLPIPARHDRFTMADVHWHEDVEIGGLLHDLSGGAHNTSTTVHLDPDLDRRPDLRLPGWRPSLGQTGAAQSHLESQGVGAGDVFLFFGWFRQVERHRRAWRFARNAPHLHVLFGWLEVGEKLAIVDRREECLARFPWIANHPHVANPGHYDNARNTLYIAPERSRFPRQQFGGGVFPDFRNELQLTTPGKSRTHWTLPEWFFPEGRTPLSYHGDPARWVRTPDKCHLRSVAKGQEFVLNAGEYSEAEGWLESIVCGRS